MAWRHSQTLIKTACLLAALVFPDMASAADYHGQVVFAGQPLPGATVTVTQDGKKLVAVSDPAGVVISGLHQALGSLDAAREGFAYLLESQACMLATNALMFTVGIIIAIGAMSICLAPKPARQVDASHVH